MRFSYRGTESFHDCNSGNYIECDSFVTGMVHRSAYLCRNMHRYGGACIRPAALTRFGLAPHPPLAKTSADP
jgi:hypothetical protein